MTHFLKADTSVDVRMGPFVAVGDGFTPVTFVIGSADEAELLKADGAATVDISGRTCTAVTSCDGWYDLTLTTDDTNTVGDVTIVLQDDSLCLPVHARFQVVNANVYDSLFAAATTDYLQVDATQIESADPTDTIRDSVVDDATRIDASALNTLSGNDPGTQLAAQTDVTGLNNISTGDVNAQVLDVLNTDTFAEPGQGAPAATASLVAKIGYLYKAWRNKYTVTDSTYTIYADDTTTVDQKATVSNDGTTFTKDEIATGP